MPKDKRRRGKGGRGGVDLRQQSDDELENGDNFSVVSSQSDTHSYSADDDHLQRGAEEDGSESNVQEEFEEKLRMYIDGLTQKSAKGRTDCLRRLRQALSKKCIYDFITDRKMTMTDGVERCVKKGKGEEAAAACICLNLLLLQLGPGEESEEIYQQLRPTLVTLMADKCVSARARSADAIDTMNCLENVFKSSYLKGDRTPPTHNPDICALHASALTAWGLLLSIAPPGVVNDLIDSHLSKVSELLLSKDIELRIVAGETLALIYELAREEDEDFEDRGMEQLCEQLKQMSTESHKYTSKKDRRQQRSSFRQIHDAIQQGVSPNTCIKFGKESMMIDSWARKWQYESLCHTLGSGMNVHLQENDLLRDIFQLGAPIPAMAAATSRVSKFERQMYNIAAFKARTKARSKFRDKRVASVSSDN
ncbi:hypothetical protein NP493_1g04015 [Ridgeia piscesae]|uniref:Interferon-related developmental regulator 1 n=1 Tax=Ridgeia piscesae TaxID=27915 RepID=A0AAD9PGI3_RIDPI|nr:hypothetical protein NP493_1g04015 [Ridgeia piscesae]